MRPRPFGVAIKILDVDGGFLIDVAIPEHRMRPYQNAINGAFPVRTGAKNTPASRDAVHAMFTSIETMEADAVRLMDREDRAVEARDIMQAGCPTLHVAIVPGAHYDRSASPFEPNEGAVLKTFPHYHHDGSHGGVFKGCEGGVEVRDATFQEGRSTSRFFIGDDWLIHSLTSHPFRVSEGENRLTLAEFGKTLRRHMRDIALIINDSGTKGPFCILMAVRGLSSNDRMRWAFPNAGTVVLPRGMVVERVDDAGVTERFHALVLRASVYG